uniref:Uncharacterized protein n=1 Tax=Panagrolaimus sp. JU765 TaxID=591449 RepID=A0AC34Q5K6_9BILA
MKRKNFYITLLLGGCLYIYILQHYIYVKPKDANDDKSGIQQMIIRPRSGFNDQEYCENELFVYKIETVNSSGKFVTKGKKFECETGLRYLKQFNLTSDTVVPNKPVDPSNVAFVIAADAGYYPSARAVIHGIRKHFGKNHKIIYYDLGGTMNNPEFSKEMTELCNFEARLFKWELLPSDVTKVKIFAWKVMIIAEVFNEFDTFFYLDSSIYFETGDFNAFYEMINNGSLTPFQMSGATGHSMRHATNPGIYKYVPLDMTIDRHHDMMEANMMIFHKNEVSKEIIKWSVLCAINRDCIEPPGSVLACVRETNQTPEGVCHRQDQSLFNILLANLEQTWLNNGIPVITHVQPNHPKNSRQRHQTRRLQRTQEKITIC